MTPSLNDKKLENVTNQVKASTILDQAKLLSVAPPRDENVMLIDGLLNQYIRTRWPFRGPPFLFYTKTHSGVLKWTTLLSGWKMKVG